mmetsp:Transcript_28639/g.39540  ORF Transcript_28639/g.39540 Transcript_28639/m.39540 type:complete len:214 (-) Transcript_28639:134-775(-)
MPVQHTAASSENSHALTNAPQGTLFLEEVINLLHKAVEFHPMNSLRAVGQEAGKVVRNPPLLKIHVQVLNELIWKAIGWNRNIIVLPNVFRTHRKIHDLELIVPENALKRHLVLTMLLADMYVEPKLQGVSEIDISTVFPICIPLLQLLKAIHIQCLSRPGSYVAPNGNRFTARRFDHLDDCGAWRMRDVKSFKRLLELLFALFLGFRQHLLD